MKDSELRGIVLERFYDARHKVDWLSLDALSTHVTIEWTQLANVCEQLGQHGLITWKALKELRGTATGMGRIAAHGVDVVEGTAKAPITITLHHDQSISVSGSTNVQIGNGNAQNPRFEVGKIVIAIDQSDATDSTGAHRWQSSTCQRHRRRFWIVVAGRLKEVGAIIGKGKMQGRRLIR